MSNLDPRPDETDCSSSAQTGPVSELLIGRDVVLGGPRGLKVTRTLPNRDVRMVGAWCFVDHFGPAALGSGPGMSVAPHPHTGLQTVSWLVEGEIRHRDSVGSDQLIVPGQLNLMTAGEGVSHAEHSPPPAERGDTMHGVQLWVALPDESRFQKPHFEHHQDLPVVARAGSRIVVLMGQLAGATSPAAAYSPIVAAEITLEAGAVLKLPVRNEFEHAELVLAGAVLVAGEPVGAGPLLYLGTGREELTLAAGGPARLLLLGGEPFAEKLVMWWNFVARSHEEIVGFRAEWEAGGTGDVVGGVDVVGARLPAPRLPNVRLSPRKPRR